MNGEGPCVRFDPQAHAFWACYTALAVRNDEELEFAYTKSRGFILKNKEVLVERYNWKETHVEDDKLFSLLSPEDGGLQYTLPSTFSSFMSAANSEQWKTLFEHGFDVRRDEAEGLYISGPRPLSDIFYLLQCIAPGMLLVTLVDDDDGVRIEYVRVLPSMGWVLSHAGVLVTVLGTEGFRHLMEASRIQGRSLMKTGTAQIYETDGGELFDTDDYWDEGRSDLSRSDDDDDFYWNETGNDTYPGYRNDEYDPDNIACGADCGYCGRCEYP